MFTLTSIMSMAMGLFNPVGRIVDRIADIYRERALGLSNEKRIAADVEIARLETKAALLREFAKNKIFWWVWTAFCIPVIIHNWKVVIWDKVLGWGTTDPLTGFSAVIATAVVENVFLTGGAVGLGTLAIHAYKQSRSTPAAPISKSWGVPVNSPKPPVRQTRRARRNQ